MKLNFLMDRDCEARFFEYLSQLGCEFLLMKSLKIYNSYNAYDFMQDDGYISVYIYHSFFGELDIYSDDSGFMAFSEINSPVISFNNSPIFAKQKAIKSGKISIKPSYLKDLNIVKKSQSLSEFYKKMTFWIEQNIPLRSIDTEFCKAEIRASFSIYDMFLNSTLKSIV